MRPHFVRSEPEFSTAESFWLAVTSTIFWAAPLSLLPDPMTALRSPSTRPRTLEASYYSAVASARRPRRTSQRARELPSRDLHGGCLLVYFPDLDLCDGAAEAESDGFFDVWNCPPWDTWIAFLCDSDSDPERWPYLLAWVPPAQLALASRGIEANPEECILWLDDCSAEARRVASG